MICDAIIIAPVDVRFDLIWRHGDGSGDTAVATWLQHFEPLGGGVYHAQPYEQDIQGAAIDQASGDELVFKFTGTSTSLQAFIPNGDGATAMGRIPNITLPQ